MLMLIKTTLRLKENLKKRKGVRKEAKKIIFKTHHLGEPLDNLTRDDFYPDPKQSLRANRSKDLK